jgi:hypothetical protein
LTNEHENPLLATPREVAVNIACQLDNALDLLRLGIACKRFHLETVADREHRNIDNGPPQTLSIKISKALCF